MASVNGLSNTPFHGAVSLSLQGDIDTGVEASGWLEVVWSLCTMVITGGEGSGGKVGTGGRG